MRSLSAGRGTSHVVGRGWWGLLQGFSIVCLLDLVVCVVTLVCSLASGVQFLCFLGELLSNILLVPAICAHAA